MSKGFITKYYKIKDKNSENFSSGGQRPNLRYFDRRGKCWKSLRDVKLHLRTVLQWELEAYLNGCDLIQYELVSGETIITNLGSIRQFI